MKHGIPGHNVGKKFVHGVGYVSYDEKRRKAKNLACDVCGEHAEWVSYVPGGFTSKRCEKHATVTI